MLAFYSKIQLGNEVLKQHLTLDHNKRLKERDLEGNDFAGLILTHADFGRFRLRKINFSHADLAGAVFRDADIEECDFTNANLRESDFRGVKFVGKSGAGVDVEGAALHGANFCNADIRKALHFSLEQKHNIICDKGTWLPGDLRTELKELGELPPDDQGSQ